MATKKHSTTRKKSAQDQQIDALLAKLYREKKPKLTDGQVNKIEEFMSSSGATRRAALIYLARPWKDITEKFEKDRDAAVAFANVIACLEDTIPRYRDMVDLMETAQLRMQISLMGREDMDAVLREGREA